MGSKTDVPVKYRLLAWWRRQSMKMKVLMAITLMFCSLVIMKHTVREHSHFFVASEFCHVVGIFVLIYKLTKQKNCTGLSLKTQILTAMFVAVRFVCSIFLEGDIHTILDLVTLVSTAWVIYTIKFKLKSTYAKDKDTFTMYHLVIPCIILSIFIHPYVHSSPIFSIPFAFCAYLEALSVLPQLRLMQNVKMIEPFTAHYVFALGLARFFAWAHWILQTYETGGKFFYTFRSGSPWFIAIFLAEIIQSFILADFCYYYIKSFAEGQLIMRMPV